VPPSVFVPTAVKDIQEFVFFPGSPIGVQFPELDFWSTVKDVIEQATQQLSDFLENQ
jgi:hypothetical protein